MGLFDKEKKNSRLNENVYSGLKEHQKDDLHAKRYSNFEDFYQAVGNSVFGSRSEALEYYNRHR